MSYEPTTWKDGDLVTSAKLNKMEQGIASGSGGSLIVHMDQETGALDKTWKEIYDAIQEKYVCIVTNYEGKLGTQSEIAHIESIHSNSQTYTIIAVAGAPSNDQWIYQSLIFITNSEDGYPIAETPSNSNVL